MIADLPLELQSSIINNIHDKEDLRSLSLTCRALREEAQRALYHSPEIDINPVQNRDRSPFLESIVSSPDRLAAVVRRITIAVRGAQQLSELHAREGRQGKNVDDERKELTDWLETVGQWLRAALHLIQGATHLQLFYDADESQYHPTWIASLIESCTFRLQVLVWEVNGVDMNSFVNKCLAQQQNLRVLKLNYLQQFEDGSETDDLLSHFCPNLRTISAPWPILRAVLRHNRNIPALELNGSVFEFSDAPSNDKREYPHVKQFWWTVTLRALPLSISSFVNLVLLQVAWLKEEDVAPVTSLKRLEVLVITGSVDSAQSPNSVALPMYKLLFKQSDSLTDVYHTFIKLYDDRIPTHSRHTYDRATGNFQTSAVYGVEKFGPWRALAGLEFAGALQI